MIISGWLNFLITSLLVLTLGVIGYHYYFGRKEAVQRAEEPKYRMLDDDEEK